MTEDESALQIEEQIAALEKLKEEVAQKVRDEGVENPRLDEVRLLLTEYDRCERAVMRLKKVLKKLQGGMQNRPPRRRIKHSPSSLQDTVLDTTARKENR